MANRVLRSLFSQRLMLKQILLSAILLFGISTISYSAVRYVKSGGTSNGFSWVTPMGSIQDAIDACNSAGGGEVWIATGTYAPASAISIKNGVSIYGGFSGTESVKPYGVAGGRIKGANITILSGSNSHVVLTNTGTISSESVIDGVTIAYGSNGQSGAGCYLAGNFYLYNCVFRNNNCGVSGAAGHIANGNVRMEECLAHDNTAANAGGAFYIDSPSASFFNCRFINNKSGNNGGAIFSTTTPLFVNCLISNNEASNLGGGVYANAGMKVINCTVEKNKAPYDGCGIRCDGMAPTITNCIISGNQSTTGSTLEINSGTVTYTGMSGTLYAGSGNQTLSQKNSNNVAKYMTKK